MEKFKQWPTRAEWLEQKKVEPKEVKKVEQVVFNEDERGVYEIIQAAKSERLSKEHLGIRERWYVLVLSEMEQGDFLEAAHMLDYAGRHPAHYFEEREEFRENAERVRELAENKRDKNLPPFNAGIAFEALRELRKKLYEREKKGEISHESAIQDFRKIFLKYRKEREWQLEGVRYLKTRIVDEILVDLGVEGGLSLREARGKLENKQEFEDVVKSGADVLGMLQIARYPNNVIDAFRIGDIINEKAKIYRLDPGQKNKLLNFLTALIARKDRSVATHQDRGDEEIAAEFLKGEPFGVISIVRGPFSLGFICSDIRDYTFFGSGIINQAGKTIKDVAEADVKQARKSGGVHCGGGIVAINNEGGQGPLNYYRFGTLLHEEQHAINEEMNAIELRERPDFRWLIESEVIGGDIKTFENLRDRLRIYRDDSSNLQAANEFVAYLRDGEKSPHEIAALLKISEKSKGLYDYFNTKNRKWYKNEIVSILKEHDNKLCNMPSFDENISKIVEEVFVKEYHVKINEAVRAIGILRVHHYSLGQIISFLQDTPFNKWLYEARKRTAEQRKKKKLKIA